MLGQRVSRLRDMRTTSNSLFATAALAGFAVFTGCGLDDADYHEPCGSTKACAYELTCHGFNGG